VSEATKELLKRALELPVGERVKLAREILESVDSVEDDELELEPEFLAELNRRADDFLAGRAAPGIPAEKVFADAERRLAERRRARGQAG
jgi:putative addiction module component (TIGR02574 family)